MAYKETIKERLDMLSPELRTFVVDETWRREAEKIGKQFNLNEVKYASFENEIFLALLCFEPLSDFEENVRKGLEIDSNMAGWVAEDVNKNIFSKVVGEIEAIWEEMEQATGTAGVEGSEQSEQVESPENIERPIETGVLPRSEQSEIRSSPPKNVGTDFEQIILNQARAMQPARAPGSEQIQTPNNLPTNGEEKGEKPKAIHNYIGSDPYREPIE